MSTAPTWSARTWRAGLRFARQPLKSEERDDQHFQRQQQLKEVGPSALVVLAGSPHADDVDREEHEKQSRDHQWEEGTCAFEQWPHDGNFVPQSYEGRKYSQRLTKAREADRVSRLKTWRPRVDFSPAKVEL